jgi:Helix-hairpin-helix motif
MVTPGSGGGSRKRTARHLAEALPQPTHLMLTKGLRLAARASAGLRRVARRVRGARTKPPWQNAHRHVAAPALRLIPSSARAYARGRNLREGWGERSVTILLAAIEKSMAVGLRRAIVGWSIPLTFDGAARRFCRHGYESIGQLQAGTGEELCEVEDIGPAVAHALREFLDQPVTETVVAALRELGVSLDVRDEDRPVHTYPDSSFAGETVVITARSRPSAWSSRRCSTLPAPRPQPRCRQRPITDRRRMRGLELDQGAHPRCHRAHRGAGTRDAR